MKPTSLVIVLSANAQQLVAFRIVRTSNPGGKGSELTSQVKIVNASARREVKSQGHFDFNSSERLIGPGVSCFDWSGCLDEDLSGLGDA